MNFTILFNFVFFYLFFYFCFPFHSLAILHKSPSEAVIKIQSDKFAKAGSKKIWKIILFDYKNSQIV